MQLHRIDSLVQARPGIGMRSIGSHVSTRGLCGYPHAFCGAMRTSPNPWCVESSMPKGSVLEHGCLAGAAAALM